MADDDTTMKDSTSIEPPSTAAKVDIEEVPAVTEPNDSTHDNSVAGGEDNNDNTNDERNDKNNDSSDDEMDMGKQQMVVKGENNNIDETQEEVDASSSKQDETKMETDITIEDGADTPVVTQNEDIDDEGTVELDEAAQKAQEAALKINNDALLSTLESKYTALQKERDTLHSQLEQKSSIERSLQANLQLARQEMKHKSEEAADKTVLWGEEKSQREAVERELKLSKERIDRVEAEGDSLRKEISRLTQLNEQHSNLLSQMQAEHSVSTSTVLPLKLDLARVQQELEAVTSHSNWVEGELSSRNEQLSNLRSSHSSEMRSIRSELDRTRIQLEQRDHDLSSARFKIEQTTSELEKIRSKLRDREHEFADERQVLESDLNKERDLILLKEQRMLIAEDQRDSLVKEVEELKTLAKEAADESAAFAKEVSEKMEGEIENAVSKVREEERNKREELEKRLSEAEDAKRRIEDNILSKGSPLRRRKRAEAASDDTPLAITNSQAGNIDDGGPLSLTNLYTRLAETEDELRAEQYENKRLKIIIERIRLDIERQTPIVRQKQVELENALDELDETKERLQYARREVTDIRSDVQDLELKNQQVERECRQLRKENVDLASQVQKLLQRNLQGQESMAGDDLVTFDSIQTLQQQNQNLLRDHHSMKEKIEELEEQINNNPAKIELDQLKLEVVSLREERDKQSQLINGIVHQRDLYRALVAKNDAALIEGGTNQPRPVDATAEQLPIIETKNRELVEEAFKLRADLSYSKRELESLESRLARVDAHAEELEASNDKLRGEVTTANATVARMEADLAHYRGRCERIETSVESIKTERDAELKRKNQMEELNTQLQVHLEAARSDAAKKEQHYQTAMSKTRLLEVQLQTAKSAEERVTSEAKALRTEIARQGVLLASVQRIEASLTAKAEEERQGLHDQVKRLTETISDDALKHKTTVQQLEGKIADIEMTLKATSSQKDEAISKAIKASEEVAQLKLQNQELSLKNANIQKELNVVNAKLRDIPADDNVQAAFESKLALLATELESTKSELDKANQRIVDYQNLAKASEKQVIDLTAASTKYKDETTASLQKLRGELDRVKKSEKSKNEAVAELTNDLISHRSDKEKAVNELKAKLSSITEELNNSKKDAASATARVDSLTAEIKSYQLNSSKAQSDYERELALHAEARAALRTTKSQVESEQRRSESFESQLAAVNADHASEKKVWETAKAKLEESLREANSILEESRNQNKILHDQMASLSSMVEKFQSEKASKLIGHIPAKNENKDDTESGENETANLQAQVSDLRELLRFKQSECVMLEADLASAKRATERERATAGLTKRSLEEARAELKLIQQNKNEGLAGASITESDLKDLRLKLKSTEEQLTLIRESNTMLRGESQRFSKQLADVQNELDESKAASAPLRENMKNIEVEKASLEAEKASLLREIDAWKNRVQSLVSKFNQVDPEDHAKVISRLEKMTEECSTLRGLKDKAESDSANAKSLIARLNKEISSQRASVDTLKNTLEKVKGEKEKLAKSSKTSEATAKQITEAKEAAKKSEEELLASKTEVNALNARVGNFRKMMQKMQKGLKEAKLAEDKAKETEESLQKEVSDLKVKLDKAEKALEEKQPTPESGPNTNDSISSTVQSDASSTKDKISFSEAALSSTPAHVENSSSTADNKTQDGGVSSNVKKNAPSPAIGVKVFPSVKGSENQTVGKMTSADSGKGNKNEGAGAATERPKKIGMAPKVGDVQKSDAVKPTVAIEDALSTTPSKKIKKISKSNVLKEELTPLSPTKTAGTGAKASDQPKTTPAKSSEEATSSASKSKTEEEMKRRMLLKKRKAAAAQKLEVAKKKKDVESSEAPTSGDANKSSKDTVSPSPPDVSTKNAVTSAKLEAHSSATVPLKEILPTVPEQAEPEIEEAEESKGGNKQSSLSKTSTSDTRTIVSGANANSGTPSHIELKKPTTFGVSSSVSSTFGSAVQFPLKPPVEETNKTSTSTPVFGSATKISKVEGTNKSTGSGTFLNLTPPGQSGEAPSFVFGKSANITLTAPAGLTAGGTKEFSLFTTKPTKPSLFGGGLGLTATFGGANKKRAFSTTDGGKEPDAKTKSVLTEGHQQRTGVVETAENNSEGNVAEGSTTKSNLEAKKA